MKCADMEVMQVSLGLVSWLNESQPILMTKGRCRGRKNISGKWTTVFCRARIVIGFCAAISSQFSAWATFARPIAGVSCPRAERRPQRAVSTHRSGATWPMECTSSAAGAAAASVSTASVRNAPRHFTASPR